LADPERHAHYYSRLERFPSEAPRVAADRNCHDGGTSQPAAQQKAMPVIGFLGSASPGPFAPFVAAFHRGLSDTGYVEGQNVVIEYRWAESHPDHLSAFANRFRGP